MWVTGDDALAEFVDGVAVKSSDPVVERVEVALVGSSVTMTAGRLMRAR